MNIKKTLFLITIFLSTDQTFSASMLTEQIEQMTSLLLQAQNQLNNFIPTSIDLAPNPLQASNFILKKLPSQNPLLSARQLAFDDILKTNTNSIEVQQASAIDNARQLTFDDILTTNTDSIEIQQASAIDNARQLAFDNMLTTNTDSIEVQQASAIDNARQLAFDEMLKR